MVKRLLLILLLSNIGCEIKEENKTEEAVTAPPEIGKTLVAADSTKTSSVKAKSLDTLGALKRALNLIELESRGDHKSISINITKISDGWLINVYFDPNPSEFPDEVNIMVPNDGQQPTIVPSL